MIPIHFHSWFSYVNQLLHTDVPKPNPSSYKLILSMANDFRAEMTAAAVFSRELPINYGRVEASWGGSGNIDAFLGAHVMPEVLFTIQALEQDLFFRSVVMVADCPTEHTMVPITGINTTTGNITTAGAHTFASNDRTLLLTDGARPEGLPDVFYTINRLSPTVVRLRDAQGQDIIPTTPGTGSLRLAYVQEPARPYFFHTFEQTIHIPSQSSRSYRLVSRVRGL